MRLAASDARFDLRFAENPHVTGEPHIRFYAGVPLRTDEVTILARSALLVLSQGSSRMQRPRFSPISRESR